MLYHSLLLFMGLAYCNASMKPSCCRDGEYMIATDEGGVCSDLISNITNDVELECNSDEDFDLYDLSEYQYSISSEDKSIKLQMLSSSFVVKDGSYCFVDFLQNVSVVEDVTQSIVMCLPKDSGDNKYAEVYSYCMLVSVVFYLLTAGIYICLPELRDLLGKCIINFCIAIALGLWILSMMNLVPYTQWHVETGHCAARGFTAYFFLVAGFFWTNVIAIQTYRSIKKANIPDYGWRTFSWYALYAWGTPVLLTTIMAIVNYVPGDHDRPGIGLSHCWFLSLTQRWYYLYSVMTILIVINTLIFAYVMYVIWRSRSYTSTVAKDIKYKSSLTLKLFLLMGIPWIFEMIESKSGSDIARVIIDIFNVLQGVAIFLILVVFRKRTLKALHQRGALLCLTDCVGKHLAVADDDEAHVVTHTDIPIDDRHA